MKEIHMLPKQYMFWELIIILSFYIMIWVVFMTPKNDPVWYN